VPHLHPDELRPRLVVANGLERLAERRVDDDPHQDYADDEDREHVEVVPVGEEVELVLAGGGTDLHRAGEQGRRRHPKAIGAAGDPEELEGEAPQDL